MFDSKIGGGDAHSMTCECDREIHWATIEAVDTAHLQLRTKHMHQHRNA